MIFERIVSALRRYYPVIELQVDNKRETLLAVIARRVVGTDSNIGSASLDDVTSAGLITLRGNLLECHYILYLMIASSDFP